MIAMTLSRDTRPIRSDGLVMRCQSQTSLSVHGGDSGLVTMVVGPGNYVEMDRTSLRELGASLIAMADADDPTI